MARKTSVLLDGLAFPEGPRWHEGALWFSDMHGHRVVRVTPQGEAETVVELPGQPSGLGWLPDGRLLVVSMLDRRLLRLEPEGLVEAADLSTHAAHPINDMVVDVAGRAYIGHFGYDLWGGDGKDFCKSEIFLVTPEGEVSVAATELAFPNGCVITPDGRTLVVGESMGARLTAFDIESDGVLTRRRTFAALEGAVPDGICLDAEGAIWLASPAGHQVIRVREGGEVLDRVEIEEGREAYACMLGGVDGCTLFVATAVGFNPDSAARDRTGRIETVDVDVPGAGRP